MTSKAPSPRSRPSSVAGMVASCDGMTVPSTQASSAVVVGAATSSAMAAYLARGASVEDRHVRGEHLGTRGGHEHVVLDADAAEADHALGALPVHGVAVPLAQA